jgi:hypothetical protein
VQGSWSRSTFKGAAESAFTDDRTQVSLGWRQRLSPHLVATAALTENVIHFKNTPDIAIHFSMGWIFPERSANCPGGSGAMDVRRFAVLERWAFEEIE